MNMATKKDIFREHLEEYLKGGKKKRGEITRHICFVTGMNTKSVPRSFRRVQMRFRGQEEKRGRQWKHAPEPTDKLLAMSLGTMKKKVGRFRRIRFPSHGKSTTSPSAIHTLVPIRTGPWDEAPAGTMQIDTVAHCGDSVAGDFVYTVNATDVATLWGSRRAQWNKGQYATVESMEHIDETTHFPVCECNQDSGSEFVNWHCARWCGERNQKMTRSRPNRKNDNCFVEERNGHIVRRWVGYARFDAP